MIGVLVRTEIDAPPDRVWEVVRDLGAHVEWMEDAVAIRFLPGPTSGVGATFDCDTRIGPIALTDRMEVTEWREGEAIGVRHAGRRDRHRPVHAGRDARRPHDVHAGTSSCGFPGGSADRSARCPGAWVLRRVWRRNLANLKRLVERDADARQRPVVIPPSTMNSLPVQ